LVSIKPGAIQVARISTFGCSWGWTDLPEGGSSVTLRCERVTDPPNNKLTRKRNIVVLKRLELHNIGPSETLKMEFGERLNLVTGDNGLGKSFLLDIAWWAMTRKWPSEINPKLTAGRKALPAGDGSTSIDFTFTSKTSKKLESYKSEYQRREQAWTGRPGRPANPGLVFYAMSDGSFAVWDPARNYWRTQEGIDVQDRIPAYVFSPSEVWDGLVGREGNPICNGLLHDWSGWYKEKGQPFESLREVLKVLSPSPTDILEPGRLTRISLDDSRDIPTIKMPYGQEVAVVHASAGMRRVLALAYLLVWTWEEHKKAAELLGEATAKQVVLLVDEVESHLHPKWQRAIIPALLAVANKLISNATVQILSATHSPLIMTSVEPIFTSAKDAWFDLDLDVDQGKVALTKRDFEKHGGADSWLISEAFDLSSTRSSDYEILIAEADRLLNTIPPDKEAIRKINSRLVEALSPKDEFLFRWRYICKKKGILNDSSHTPDRTQ
jgi:hypothetical protein